MSPLIFVGLKGYNEYIKHLCASRSAVSSKTFRKSRSSECVRHNTNTNDLTLRKSLLYSKRQTVKEISQLFEALLKE